MKPSWQTYQRQQQLQNNISPRLVDATESSWASPPTQTDCVCMFKFNCQKLPTTLVEEGHAETAKTEPKTPYRNSNRATDAN